MKSDITAKIMLDIVGTIKCSHGWVQATDETPMLIEERKRLEKIIARVPDDLRHDLEEAIAGVEEAYADMALLYGMRVAGAMQKSINNPMNYSRCALNTMLDGEERMQLIHEGRRSA